MKQLAVLLALFCCTATFALAATKIVVTKGDGTITTYTDMPSAEENFKPGDTMDIQSFDGPLPWAGDGPTWATVKCTAATPATIQVAKAAGTFGPLDHNTYENLIIEGGATIDTLSLPVDQRGWATALNGGTKSTVTNCTFKGFWWYPVYIANGTGEEGATFTNCYIIGIGSAVGFTAGWLSAGQNCTNKTIFNHCTIIGKTWWAIDIDANFDGKDNSNIFSLRNSIVSTRKDANGSDIARCIIFNSDLPGDAVIDEDYNLFDSWWMVFWANHDTGKGDPVGAHSVKWDYRANPDIFTDYANGNYSLNSGGSNPCLKAGENGTNIGAENQTVPVELSSFSAE